MALIFPADGDGLTNANLHLVDQIVHGISTQRFQALAMGQELPLDQQISIAANW